MIELFQTIKNLLTNQQLPKDGRIAFAYHNIQRVSVVGSDLFTVTRRNFIAQVNMIKHYFIPVTVEEYLSAKIYSKPKALLTFDDGKNNNFSEIFPILKDMRLPAVFFVTTDFIGQPGYMTKEQIQEIALHGLEIGSHSASHQDFGVISKRSAEQELKKSKDIIESITNTPVTAFAYPYGNMWNTKDYDKALLQKLGYSCAFLFGMYHTDARVDVYRLPRFMATDILETTLFQHCKALLKTYSSNHWL